jgi:hypothetical protein
MRRSLTLLMATMLFGCTTPAPAPPPSDLVPTSLEPYQVFRSAEFNIVASDATACASRQASQHNLAQNFVIGDLASINRQFPRVQLTGATGQPLYAVMSLLNNDDTMPQWIVTAEPFDGDHSLVTLRNGGDPTENIAKFDKLWLVIRNCQTANP